MQENRVPSVLNFLAGIWMLISPWVLGIASIRNVTGNNVLLGIAVLILAASRAWGGQGVWASWTNVVLGLWVLISPWALGFAGSGTASTNNVLFGIIIAALALWAGMITPGVRTGAATFAGAEPREDERWRR